MNLVSWLKVLIFIRFVLHMYSMSYNNPYRLPAALSQKYAYMYLQILSGFPETVRRQQKPNNK